MFAEIDWRKKSQSKLAKLGKRKKEGGNEKSVSVLIYSYFTTGIH